MNRRKRGAMRAVVLLVLAASASAAVAQPPSSAADSTALANGSGASYWGDIPAPSDSTQTAFRNRSRAAWEWALIVPYSVINLPLRYLRLGTGAGVRYADRTNLFRFVSFVPVPRGWVPRVDYNSQMGLMLGVNYYNRLGRDQNPFRIRAQYSTEQWQKYTAGFIINKDGTYQLHGGAGYRYQPNLHFYGIGPNTVADDRSFYKDERSWFGVNLRRSVGQKAVAALIAVQSAVDAKAPTEDNEPTLEDNFPKTPPGYDQRSEGTMVRLALVHNNVTRHGNPDSGTLVGGTVGGFVSTSGEDVSFLAYRFEFQKFMSLWHSGRSLALRAYANWIDNQGDSPVPFQRLFINESPDLFRGYDNGRFRDRGITGVTLEYRFPFIADRKGGGFGIDTVLLTDIGQVFGEFEDIKGSNLTYSYGFGWRVYINEYYGGSLEFVWSEDGFQFRIATKQLFQFSQDVLFNGREETLIH